LPLTGPWMLYRLQLHRSIAWPNSSTEMLGKRTVGLWIGESKSAFGLVRARWTVTAGWRAGIDPKQVARPRSERPARLLPP
jgi:hypothetical protein